MSVEHYRTEKRLSRNTRSMHADVDVRSLHAVVIWKIVTLTKQYRNPSTSFTVSVSIARRSRRFGSVRTSLFILLSRIVGTCVNTAVVVPVG